MSSEFVPLNDPPPPDKAGAPEEGPPPVARAVPPRVPPRRGVPGPVWVLLGCLLLGGCALFGMVAAIGGSGLGMARAGALIEETVQGKGDAKVVLVELEGMIARVQGGGLFGGGVDLVDRLRRELEAAADDKDVKALVLSIDSPGGTVTASDQIWKHVKRFREKTGRPVVIHMGALCASGGYYIAVAGDEIVCEPTTITGSIGVVLSTLNFHDLLEKYGIRDVTITSGPNKDLLNPTGPLREEHLRILKQMVDETHARFTRLVHEGRGRTGLTLEEVQALADGRIFTADQALAQKLVDHIGYRQDALDRAASLAGVAGADVRLVRYARPPTLADLLSASARLPGAAGGGEPRLDPALLDDLATPRLMVLWRGGR
ncbi:MAG: signal peptide peptidase SppA [Planctomycetes bacterium]|nr:signal peptide peptidase SppA [Planctomycetota bacterium]